MDLEELSTDLQTQLEQNKQEILTEIQKSLNKSTTSTTEKSLSDFVLSKLDEWQRKGQAQIERTLREQNERAEKNQTTGKSDIEKLYKTAETSINNSFQIHFAKLTAQTKKNNFKTFLNVLVCCFVLLLGGVGATLYVWNYHDGKQIAEQRAELALKEREQDIKNLAIKEYQESDQFVIDGATYVANNFMTWQIAEIMYQEMPIKDKKALKLYDWLNKCHKEYKKKFEE